MPWEPGPRWWPVSLGVWEALSVSSHHPQWEVPSGCFSLQLALGESLPGFRNCFKVIEKPFNERRALCPPPLESGWAHAHQKRVVGVMLGDG